MIDEGDNLTISCTTIGIPAPTISWTFNGQVLQTDHIIMKYQRRVVATLQIVDAQFPEDDGVYVCTGSNTYGGITNSSSATVAVVVLEPGTCVYECT